MSSSTIPIIDCHTHIGYLPGVLGDRTTAQDLDYILNREGASLMLVSSASSSTVDQIYGTDEMIAMVQHYERLVGVVWLNPRHPAWRADLERAAGYGCRGIKIHPVLDHYAVEPDALVEVFEAARAHSWPILTHADVDGTPMSAARYEPLLQAYPDVRLILAHLRLEAIPLAKRYANAYVDTTYVDPMMVEIGVDAVGADKILFGSDAAEGFDIGRTPGRERPRRSYAGLVAGLRARGLSDAVLEKVLCRNAQHVFDLPELGSG